MPLFQGHAGTVSAVAFDQSEDRLASASYDRTVRVWDVATSVQRQKLAGVCACMSKERETATYVMVVIYLSICIKSVVQYTPVCVCKYEFMHVYGYAYVHDTNKGGS